MLGESLIRTLNSIDVIKVTSGTNGDHLCLLMRNVAL